jgi:ATP-dependent helicase/nuclease subunit A
MTRAFLAPDDAAFLDTIARQTLAANPAVSVWASANAGAGKTKVLIDRIVRLLLAGADPGRVLAVTYTKAAAAEMQTRLFEVLGGWTIARDEVLRAALRRLDPTLDLDAPGQIARARGLFAKALETPGGLKIQTIHAFCQAILQRFPLEAGVAPGFDTLEEAECARLRARAFIRAETMDPEAFAVVMGHANERDDEKAVVDAALGDSETLAAARAMGPAEAEARLRAWMGTPGEETPAEIRATGGELVGPALLAELADALMKSGPSDQKCADRLRALAGCADPVARFEGIIDLFMTKDRAGVRKSPCAVGVADVPCVLAMFGPKESWAGGGGLFARLLDIERRAARAALARRSAMLTRAACAQAEAFESAKAAAGALDFDDLLEKVRALLTAGAGAAQWVLFKLDAGIEHVLIDEAQDTSPDQWELLAPLFAALEEETRAGPRTRFVVGDEKQSIYSFQGARPDRFLAEKRAFEAKGAETGDDRRSLGFDLSFRTGQTILDAVDLVWATGLTDGPPAPGPEPESEALEKKWALPVRHLAHRAGLGARVEHWPLAEGDEKAAPLKDGDDDPTGVEPWQIPLDAENERSAANVLARRIAEDLARRLKEGHAIWGRDGAPRAMTPGDVMILVRRRNALFHGIIRALKAQNVPVAGADRLILTEDPGVQDLLAMARFALLPEDDFNVACVLKGAFCGLLDDDAHLFPLAHGREWKSLWSRLCESEDPRHAGPRALMQGVLDRGGALPAHEFFAALLDGTGPDGRTGWRMLIERLGRETREPVEALLTRALNHGRREPPSLQAFLDMIAADDTPIKREGDQTAAGVRVMTVHGAKGLEAPVVILPDLTGAPRNGGGPLGLPEIGAFVWPGGGDGKAMATADLLTPLREAVAIAERQESRRLLYVAMTRARDLLILAGHWNGQTKAGRSEESWEAWVERALEHLEGARPETRDFGTVKVWGEGPPPMTGAAKAAATAVTAPDWMNAPAGEEARPPRRVAPSALAPDGAEPAALSPLSTQALARFRRGRLIHELLQRLPDLPDDARRGAAARRLAREPDLSPEQREDMTNEALAVLAHPDFAPIFGPDSRAEAAIVGAGPGLPPGLVVNGSVDRLVATEHEVLVIDFKTNRPPPVRVEDVAEVYVAQMAAYRALLQAAWPGRAVRCALVWTDGPRLMELPEAAMDAALRGLSGHPR